MKKNISSSGKTNGHQVAALGRSFVESELKKRGAASVTSEGTQKIYLKASNSDGSRIIQIQVKTKRGKGNWHSKTAEAEAFVAPPDPSGGKKFWVFVDSSGARRYWVVTEWWIRNDIYTAHQAY